MTSPLPMLTPVWPAPSHVRSHCTTRLGGVSLPPFVSLNLGNHVGDIAQSVLSNRLLLAENLGVRPVFMTQVHGAEVHRLESTSVDGVTADACLTTERGLACTIMVADCLPVLLTDKAGSFVAAAHAGWRGLAGHADGGVLESVFKSIVAERHSIRAQATVDVIAWLGPCIGPEAFEVGAEVRAAFVHQDAQAAVYFRALATGKWLCDLQGLARLRLRALGVTQVFGNDGSTPWCTLANPSKFFSHRRDRVSGRMAACIWLA